MSEKKQKIGSIFLIMLMIASSFTALLIMQPIGNAAPAPYESYSYNRLVTVNSTTQVGATLTNFPMWFSIVNNSLKSVVNGGLCQDDGGDIAFWSENNLTQYPYEVESYNNVTGTLGCWINISSLTSGSNFNFYMYYRNTTIANQADPTHVWDTTQYLAVWHFNNLTNGCLDSTGNGFNLRINGSDINNRTYNLSGITSGDKATGHWNGTYYTHNGFSSIYNMNHTNNTREIWLKYDNVTQDINAITYHEFNYGIFIDISGGNANKINFNYLNSPVTAWRDNIGTSKANEKGCWYHYTGAYNADTGTYVWVNKTQEGCLHQHEPVDNYYNGGTGTEHSPPNLSNNNLIGAGNDGIGPKANATGNITEARYERVALSNETVNASHSSFATPDAFFFLGPETETEGGEPEPGEPIGYDMTPGSEVSEWNVSENVIGGTLEEDWAYLGGTWDTRLAPNWGGNHTLRATFNATETIVAALCNQSVMNRSQSLAWARVNVSLQNYSYVFPGIVYAIRNSSSFSFVCFGDMEVFLLDYIDGSIYNTLNLSLVEYYQDATNYMDLWGFSQKPQEETVYHFEPYNASGLWMKTIYNGYPGILNAKDWGFEHEQQVLYNLMDEPLGWAFNGSTNNSANISYGFGVCAWRPADETGVLNQVEFDCIQSWRLNSSVNDEGNCWDPEMRGYRPHMNFSIIDTMTWSGDAGEFFFDDGEGNMSVDEVIPILRNMTSDFEMESRKYIPHADVNELYWNGALDNGGGGSTTPNPFYDQLDNVYYYPAMFTNLTGYFGPEFPFNNALFLEIYDCTDGYIYDEDDSYDYTFVAIDVDNDCSWDENDKAFYVDTNGNAVMWEGNGPAGQGDFFGDAFLTDQSSYRNLHRYNEHVHYYMLIPLDELMKESQIPLGEGDIFGLHIDTGNQDEWYSSDGGQPFVGNGYSCIWENWYEATDEQYIDEVYGFQQITYIGNPFGPYEMFMGGFDGPPVCTIIDENLPYWGEGQIGNGTVNQTYNNKGISVTKEYSDEAGPWILHYWVNVTNTGIDEINDFWLNETWPTGTVFLACTGEEGAVVPELDGKSFHITTTDITFGSLYTGETFQCEMFLYGLIGNGSCFTNRVRVDDEYGNYAWDNETVCWEISVEKTGPHAIEEGTTQTWWNISVCNTGDIPLTLTVEEPDGSYNNQTYIDSNNSDSTPVTIVPGLISWDITLNPGDCWWVNITFGIDPGLVNGTRLYNTVYVNETSGDNGPGDNGGDIFTGEAEGNDGDGTLYGAYTFALLMSYDTISAQIPTLIYAIIVFLVILCVVLAAKLIMDKFNENKKE